MRFLNSLRNSAAAFVGQIVTIVLGVVLRWFFVHYLGQDYLGVNSVMESMVTILSMTDLGIGTSVTFALYKPIADGDEKRVGALMAFYRKVYMVIGFGTALLGPFLLPFMRFFTREATDVPHMTGIYLLFLANTALSYFFAYKRTLLSAYEENYVNSITEDTVAVFKYLLQGMFLFFARSYIGYLSVSLAATLVTNLIISHSCDRKHPFVKKYHHASLYPEDKAQLKTSIVSMLYQNIGAKLVTGTDNLMISYAKLTLMGIYSNYAMVVSIAARIVYNVLHSIMGSIGNLMVEEDNAHKSKVYEEFFFATFCFYCLLSVGFAGCLERFLLIWAGDGWLLGPSITFIVILNFFLNGLRQPNVVIIEAAGLFNKMRAKAVSEVIVNLVVSLLFLIVFDWGIYGVLLGTTVSMVSVCIWWETGAVHRFALHTSVKRFWRQYAGYLVFCAGVCFVTYFLCRKLPMQGIPGLFVSGVISVALFGAALLVCYGRTGRFRSLAGRFFDKLKPVKVSDAAS